MLVFDIYWQDSWFGMVVSYFPSYGLEIWQKWHLTVYTVCDSYVLMLCGSN